MILLVCLLTLPVFAQSVSKPAAAPPMPGEDPTFVPTIEHPYKEPVFVAPEPIVTSEHLIAVVKPDPPLSPLPDAPIRAHCFSLPWRLVRVGEKAAEKIDAPLVKASEKD